MSGAAKSGNLPASLRFGLVFLAGLLFGMVVGKSGVSAPSQVHMQFLFSRFVMFKVLFSGAASSTAAFLLLYFVNPQRFQDIRSTFGKGRGWYSIIFGSSLLGVAMGLCGGCAGTFVTTLGYGVGWLQSFAILGGLFSGTWFFGFIEPYVTGFLIKSMPSDRFQNLDTFFGVKYPVVAVPVILICYGGVVFLEAIHPWRTDLPASQLATINDNVNPFWWGVWPPAFCGLFMFPVQLLLSFSSKKVLGCATGLSVLATQLLRPLSNHLLGEKHRYLNFILSISGSWDAWWTVTFITGVFLLPVMNSLVIASHTPIVSHFQAFEVGMFPWWMTFLGAFLSVQAARFGIGCSGHNALSGFPLLSFAALLSLGGFFVGGIPTVLLMKAAGYDIFTIAL